MPQQSGEERRGEERREEWQNSLMRAHIWMHNGKNRQGDNSLNVIELNTVGAILAVIASYCVTICAPE